MVVKGTFAFVCFYTFTCVFSVSYASYLLSVLWDEDSILNNARKYSISSDEDNVLVRRLSKIEAQEFMSKFFTFQLPFTNQIKSDAWYKILRYRRVENLDISDWQKYESIIPNLPVSMLRQLNFSDDFVMSFFGQQKLTQTQLSQLADEVSVNGGDVLASKEKILKLGNIFCGFPASDLATVKESTLRYLLEKGFFQSIKTCGFEQLSTLAKLMEQRTIIGPPSTWEPETVKKAGSLIAGLKPRDIREISERSFSQISSEVIALTPLETLREFKDSQLKTLDKSALLTWRRKTRDLRKLYLNGSSGCLVKIQKSKKENANVRMSDKCKQFKYKIYKSTSEPNSYIYY